MSTYEFEALGLQLELKTCLEVSSHGCELKLWGAALWGFYGLTVMSRAWHSGSMSAL